MINPAHITKVAILLASSGAIALSLAAQEAPPEAGDDGGLRDLEAKESDISPGESLKKGIEFLLADQNSNGSWGSFESSRPNEVYLDNLSSHRAFHSATTALCVMALHGALDDASEQDVPRLLGAVKKGLHYLLTAEQPGRASGGTFYNTWAHTYMVQALAQLHADERFAAEREEIAKIAAREIKTLDELQNASGAWGYYDFSAQLERPTGEQSTSFNTSAALLAYRDAKNAGFEINQQVIDDAIASLERMRLPSGAYIYGFGHRYSQTHNANQIKGSLGRSQPCNLALLKYEREITKDDLKKGLANLEDLHHFIEIGRGRPVPHEGWYSTAGYYYFFGHYYASRVILELDEADQKPHAEWLANIMATRQDPDGSWFDFPFYGYSKQYGSAFAVMTLQNCLKALELGD